MGGGVAPWMEFTDELPSQVRFLKVACRKVRMVLGFQECSVVFTSFWDGLQICGILSVRAGSERRDEGSGAQRRDVSCPRSQLLVAKLRQKSRQDPILSFPPPPTRLSRETDQ